MTETAHTSDSEMDDPNKITDAVSCLDYLKRREVFLYKMMNDPSHKAMLYFLEVLMNSDSPITVDQLAERFSHKSFSVEMRDACGGGSADGLREFLQRYPSLFNVKPNGQVTSVTIELPGLDSNFGGSSDQESCSIKESGHKSINENLSDSSSSLQNFPYNFDSNYSSKTCPISCVQKEYAYSRFQSGRKPNPSNTNTNSNINHNSINNNNRLNSTSCLSLVSDQSISSSNGSSNFVKNSSDHSLGRKKSWNNYSSGGVDTTSYKNVANTTTSTTTNNDNDDNEAPLGLSSKNPPILRAKPSNVYQPPQLRNLEHGTSSVLSSSCELCSSSSNVPTTINSSGCNALLSNHHEFSTMTNGTCIHCPLIELTCHHHTHHCTTAHHHSSSAHCHCTTSPLTANPSAPFFHHIHDPIHKISTAQNTLRSPSILLPNYYNLPVMEKFILESEAVHFFQQKLIKREERWIPIKSLAGHLSQASPEVRAIVGPQLEFRRFLLKHPHVFEVQGDLVSVKDPFTSVFGLKRSHDRLSAIHSSHSSSNLYNATQTYLPRNKPYERNPRPKSLVLPNMVNFGHLSNVSDGIGGYYTPSSSSSIQRSTAGSRHRRSAHFLNDNSTKSPQNKTLTESESISSVPATPINSNLVSGISSRVQTERLAVDKSTNSINNNNNNIGNSDGVSSTSMTAANDTSSLTNSLPSVTSNTMNSISLTMSANEYRAIMFLRKVLEKHGGSAGQSGLSLQDVMQFLSNKASETVQTTIGWTKIELEEFLSQHNLFFELKSIKASFDNGTNDTDCSQVKQCQQQKHQQLSNSNIDYINVCNKRLNRMINIIITASKPIDFNGVRTLTNRCGRIFHVAKLWGIIDLGKHEHVFFDKSIFRHVDDLQKHFKVDEILYFNAVLAPKESRAKWRATHVWKECDRENVEKFGALSHMKKLNSLNNSHNKTLLHNIQNFYESDIGQRNGHNKSRSREVAISTMDHEGNVGTTETTISTAADDDTEVEEEIEDFIVETCTNNKERELVKSNQNHLVDNDSDLEYALAGDEEIEDDGEEPFVSPIAHEEGLHLPIDIKFIPGELEEEMQRVLNFQSKHNHNKTGIHLLSNSKSSCLELYDSSHSTELCNQTQSEPCYIKSNGNHTTTVINNNDDNYIYNDNNNRHNRHHSLVTSSTESTRKPMKNTLNHLSKEDSGTSSSLSEMSGVSIAVQTVSTGDIMTTQLYHDNKA
uniref:Phosphodiesterase I n=1 Tax=Schistosoma mansoni TaxID=6183 RepID=A0A3Q0KNA8_SCHMA